LKESAKTQLLGFRKIKSFLFAVALFQTVAFELPTFSE